MSQHLCILCLFSCSQVLAASPLEGDATEQRGDRISLFTHYAKFRLVILAAKAPLTEPLSTPSSPSVSAVIRISVQLDVFPKQCQ